MHLPFPQDLHSMILFAFLEEHWAVSREAAGQAQEAFEFVPSLCAGMLQSLRDEIGIDVCAQGAVRQVFQLAVVRVLNLTQSAPQRGRRLDPRNLQGGPSWRCGCESGACAAADLRWWC